MPRPRINDPVGLSDNPVCVTDPVREAELVSEVRRKLDYIAGSYRAAKNILRGGAEFNQAVRDLKAAVERGTPAGLSGKRLHPLLELEVNREARAIARARSGSEQSEVIGDDIRMAARAVAGRIKVISSRPSEGLLRRHFEGAVAVAQEASGKPVLSSRWRGSDYNPRMREGMAQGVYLFFRGLEPSVPEGRLVTMLEQARRKYRHGWPRFVEFFPLYGAIPGADGAPILRTAWHLDHFEPVIPTFFH